MSLPISHKFSTRFRLLRKRHNDTSDSFPLRFRTRVLHYLNYLLGQGIGLGGSDPS